MSLGVLSALAVIWSGVETWSSCRRSGHVGIDHITLGKLIIFACGNLANVFFFVVACASFHTFIFYKGQSAVQVLLPSHAQDQLVRNYVILSFCLKVSNGEGYVAAKSECACFISCMWILQIVSTSISCSIELLISRFIYTTTLKFWPWNKWRPNSREMFLYSR